MQLRYVTKQKIERVLSYSRDRDMGYEKRERKEGLGKERDRNQI